MQRIWCLDCQRLFLENSWREKIMMAFVNQFHIYCYRTIISRQFYCSAQYLMTAQSSAIAKEVEKNPFMAL